MPNKHKCFDQRISQLATAIAALIWMVIVVSSADPVRADEPGATMSIPTPKDVFELILPPDEVQGKGLKEVLSHGVIQKWSTPLQIYFAVEREEDKETVSALLDEQLIPLMKSVSASTGVHFKRVYATNEANFIMAFSERSNTVFDFLDVDETRRWFGAADDQFSAIIRVFSGAESQCFRFIDAPSQQITRALTYTSTTLARADMEKCMARNLLFALGLRGATSNPISAKSAGSPSGAMGVLDELALDLIYHSEVKPGMTLNEAISAQSGK
jgi:hypothetical protein